MCLWIPVNLVKALFRMLFINDVHIVTFFGLLWLELWVLSSELFPLINFLSPLIQVHSCLLLFHPSSPPKPISYRPLVLQLVFLLSQCCWSLPVVENLWLRPQSLATFIAVATYATWSVGARNPNSAGPDPGQEAEPEMNTLSRCFAYMYYPK